AAALASEATAGHVLATATVGQLAGTLSPHLLFEAGRLTLGGLAEPVQTYEVRWEADALKPLTVVIADGSALLRSGIAGILAANGFQVIGEAGDADVLLGLVANLDPDLAIVDIRMPPTHTLEGIRAAARIRAEHPRTGVLILSQHLESQAG